MATVAELEARLEELRAQRDNAVARVSYDGRSLEYRGTAEPPCVRHQVGLLGVDSVEKL
jgi:hypothetical protein